MLVRVKEECNIVDEKKWYNNVQICYEAATLS